MGGLRDPTKGRSCCCAVLAEMNAGVGEHMGNSRQTWARLPGRGHLLAEWYRISGLPLDRVGGRREVFSRGVSSWKAQRGEGILPNWSRCEMTTVQGTFEGRRR